MASFQKLHIERRPNEQVVELLEENVVGTPGKSILYQLQDVQSKVNAISNPYFANLSIRNRLYGTICLSKRNVYSLNKLHQAFYLRYFTFRESIRTARPKNHNRKTPSLIREDVAKLMDGEGLDFDEKLLLYAYVDVDNIRSKRLIDEFGFSKAGEFNVIAFSRLFPKFDSRVCELESAYQNVMKSLLLDFYRDELLVTTENMFERGTYFVLKINSEIVCGVQAIKDSWVIKELPGVAGKIMMKIVPKLPLLNRLFNPHYKFVFLESIYCKAGHEKELEVLLQSVLSYFKLYSGVICLDPRSKMYSTITSLKLGLPHKIMGENKNDIVLKTHDRSIINSTAPFYISGYDVL